MKLSKKITSRTIFFFYYLDINAQDPKCKLKTLFLYIKKESDIQGRCNKKKMFVIFFNYQSCAMWQNICLRIQFFVTQTGHCYNWTYRNNILPFSI
jgi:hypothetical protein